MNTSGSGLGMRPRNPSRPPRCRDGRPPPRPSPPCCVPSGGAPPSSSRRSWLLSSCSSCPGSWSSVPCDFLCAMALLPRSRVLPRLPSGCLPYSSSRPRSRMRAAAPVVVCFGSDQRPPSVTPTCERPSWRTHRLAWMIRGAGLGWQNGPGEARRCSLVDDGWQGCDPLNGLSRSNSSSGGTTPARSSSWSSMYARRRVPGCLRVGGRRSG
jgi:hypothetical protein